MLKKIVIIGPESTGKSTLSALLAEEFGTLWVPEYAREYLRRFGKSYGYQDLLEIAKGQLAGEDSLTGKLSGDPAAPLYGPDQSKLLFIDTDMYVMKVWSEFVFGRCHSFILNEAASRKYDLYLLCDVDLPWVADELREYPDPGPRNELFDIYKDVLINQRTPWVIVRGDYPERFRIARDAVYRLISGK